jgi:hypothetical protein
LTNTIGLSTVVSFEERTRAIHMENLWDKYPWDTWKAARERVFAGRKWLYIAIIACFVVLLFRAVVNRDEWIALTLGSGLIPFVTTIPGYYYSFLLVYAFFWPRFPWVGVSLLTVSLVSNLAPAIVAGKDDVSLVTSVAVLLFVTGATAAFALTDHTPLSRRTP